MIKLAVKLLVALGLCFCCANAQNAFVDTIKVKPLGKLVDIGGYRLHINCTGKGDIPVVLISGAGNFSFDWSLVQSKLSKSALVCSYDRPSLAWSDAGPMPRSLEQDVYELHELLINAKVKPPYILVGHSIGGIIARIYAKQYHKDVAGIVLVDATSENAILNVYGKLERLRLLASLQKRVPPIKTKEDSLTKVPSQKEVEDLWNMFGKPYMSFPFNKLPADIQKTRLWAQSLPKYQIADAHEYMAEEFAEMYSDNLNYKLGNMPLIILSSTKNEYPEELGQT